MVLSYDEAVADAKDKKFEGATIVVTNGCFDVLHLGHIRLLRKAAEYGTLYVAVDSDDRVRKLKGPTRPVNVAPERAEVVNAIKGVHCVFVFDVPASNVMMRMRPDVLVKGSEWKDSVQGVEHAGQLIHFKHTGHSTSEILKLIFERFVGE